MGVVAKPVLSSFPLCSPLLPISSSCFLGRFEVASRVGRTQPPNLVALTRPSPSSPCFRLYSSRRKAAGISDRTSRNRKKIVRDQHDDKDLDKGALEADEDALEALFSMLEEDLKNDDLSWGNDDDEITEEDLAKLEQELEDALNDVEDDDVSLLQGEEGEGDEDDEEEVVPLKLKTWQLRRLASALKVGRRKTNIKSLAAELGLERAVVLELLRDPPPNLLLLSASLPEKVLQSPVEPARKPLESSTTEAETKSVDISLAEVRKTEDKRKEPIHTLRNRWSEKKRLKKVQIETLERVYARTKHPTNAMISSIVHVTNLPRKSVLKWFEDKHLQEGVPDRRLPFHRETIS